MAARLLHAGPVVEWALLFAITAVGMKSKFRSLVSDGGNALILLVSGTLVLTALPLMGVQFIP